MEINNLIILGENGMLGNYIKKYFLMVGKINVIGINRQIFDAFIDDIPKLEDVLKNYLNNKTVIINAIGVIPQASKNYEVMNNHYTKINIEFPHKLSQLCNKYNTKLIHPSTDCVYTGKKGKYVETDIHDETNIYGISKSKGEPTDCTVIRTSIIGEEVNNHRSLVEWIKSNSFKEVNGYINHYWNGITCLQYAKLLEYMINNNIFWMGVRHIYSPITVSKYELVKIINDMYNLNIRINKFETPNIVDKSISTIYNENKLFNIPELEQQIKEMKDFSSILYN